MLMVDGEEMKRLRQLERVVLNQLGTTDPREVAAWIVKARERVRIANAHELGLLPHVARCAPQADGASEQDVIALQRAYTAEHEAESRGSC